MKENMYIQLHSAADRLALEAARKTANGTEARVYIATYQRALDFLISEHKKNKVEA